MNEQDSAGARAEIMEKIRKALGDRGGPAAPPVFERAAATERHEDNVARFVAELEAAGGRVQIARGLDQVRVILKELTADLGVRELALSDDPMIRSVAASLDAIECFDGSRDRKRLFACDAGLSSAQQAIAETGTLVLESSAERHRLVSLVPPLHLVLLPARAIVASLDKALAALQTGDDGRLSPCISLITGPSRTGDIEMKLVVGVHGPRELHVIVMEENTE